MSAVRMRRLQADYQKLQDYATRHPRLQLIQTEGTPPEKYQLQYQIRGLRQKDEELIEVTTHVVEIALPRNYPRTPPQCRMLTPIFHPNIAPHAICIGDHWSAGESLASIVARIGELIAYQSYNTKSPLNGEAARWTTENLDRLPLDSVNMVLDEAVEEPPRPPANAEMRPPPAAPVAPRAPAPAPAPAVSPEAFLCPCPHCSSQLRISPQHRGTRIRCPRCKTIILVPS